MIWQIEHCANVTEDTYIVQIGAWNPLDDWMWLEKPYKVEVLERIGPIFIDDFNTINDRNESKAFHVRFAKMGTKTCITVDYGDGSRLQFFGSTLSCKMRYDYVTENMVGFVDPVMKNFLVDHTYLERGLYQVIVNGFDERSYAERTLDVTIFRMPCKVSAILCPTVPPSLQVPSVWLPVNETSWLRPERVPKSYMSKPLQVSFKVLK